MKAISALILALLLSLPGRCANITVTYSNYDDMYPWTQEAINSFEAAVAIWEQTVYSPVEIRVKAYYLNFELTLADNLVDEKSFWFNSDFIMNFGSSHPAYFPQHDYPPSLAEKLNGSPLNSWNNGPFHFTVYIDNQTPWDFSESYNPSQDHFDFISIVLKEIAHGLGFESSAFYSPALAQPSHQLIPYILDRNTINASFVYLNSISQSGSASYLTSNDIYYNGNQAVAANSGSWPKLFAPSFWRPHSLCGWDSSEFSSTDPDALMHGGIPANSAQSFHRQIGKVTKGLMADIGWDLEPPNGAPNRDKVNNIHLFPNPSSSGIYYLNVPEIGYYEVFSLSGNSLQKSSINEHSLNIVDLSSYPQGVYVLRITSASSTFYQRLIKSAQ